MPTVTGVINEFAHPPLGAVTRELLPATLTGDGTLQRVRGPITVDAWGLQLGIFTKPVHWGTTVGNPDYTIGRYIQIASVYRLLDLSDVILDIFDIQVDGQMIWWSQPLPLEIKYHVEPGFVVTAHWLVTF